MKKLLSIISALTLLSACSLDIPYENQFSDPTAISSPQTARELLSSAYAALPNPEFDLSILADDFAPTYWAAVNSSMQNQYNWQPQAIEDLSISYWNDHYAVIATLNALIERAHKIEDSPTMRRILGEAMALKAYCYFQLLRVYGAGPQDLEADAIVLKDELAMANLPRSSARSVLAEIDRLLSRALPLIEEEPSASTDWMSADAALILRSQARLYAGEYGSAATDALAVIDRYGYEPFAADAYRSFWQGDQSAERIFALNAPSVAQSFYISLVYDNAGGDYFTVSPSVAASFAADDIRLAASVFPMQTTSLGTQNCLGKYNAMRKNQREILLINKTRLADALFAYCEASALAGNNQQALTAINKYLEKRGAEPINDSLTGDNLLSRILAEKQKEFLGEGVRFFDLKFYRDSVLKNKRMEPDDYRWLWPIPREEYLYNDLMTQNPSWTKTSFN